MPIRRRDGSAPDMIEEPLVGKREVTSKVASLNGKIAVVTGATRGLGRGIALGLGEAGATVYVTGRSTEDSRGELPGTVESTAAEVTRLGGQGVGVRCDHRIDSEVEGLFASPTSACARTLSPPDMRR